MTVQDLPGLAPLTSADLAALGLGAEPARGGSAERRLRVVREPSETDGLPREGTSAPLVGYLVLVPAGTDPARLLAGAAHPPTPPQAAPPARDAVEVDAERRLARVEGRQLDLTYLEFELLAHLVAHPARVHSREQLVGAVWGYAHVGDGRTVDVHIARLRRKLGRAHRDRIVTVRRVGYKYLPDGQAAAGKASADASA
ncbi:winged helix-turn-helix domain-containing protein [Streptomyces xiaopingdaonensis]|uniref:winged helix-turn-helix domain-containing protein n=1 Tax=Streptomyces xiaopingdaonensis TaxID=1565415 RepID=UPI0002F8F463|nr:winged helix-turn-helix domain-containing protein [Streptomyces xiaopingdaonensis]